MTHTLTFGWTRSGETISRSVTIDVEGEQNLDVVVPGSTTNEQVLLTIDVSTLALVFIDTDQAVTIKTNSTSAPDQTITLTAGKPLAWYTGCGWSNPFATDITALYITRATSGDATVKLRWGYDATP